MSDLTPPDLERCQADKPGNGPFIMGGEIGDPNNGYRTRCKDKPDFVATETKPGDDRQRGSMSLCGACRLVIIKQCGEDHCTFVPVNMYETLNDVTKETAMKLVIEIEMDNAAFTNDAPLEVKRVLIDYMFRMQAHRDVIECSLRDINGKTVGSVKIEGKLVPGDCCPECAGMVYTMPSGDLGCKDCKWSKEDR